MKTKMNQTVLNFTLMVTLSFISLTGNALNFIGDEKNVNTHEKTKVTSVTAEQRAKIGKEIKQWVTNELLSSIDETNLQNNNYSATIRLIIDENGEMVNYSYTSSQNPEFKKLIESVMEKTPLFMALTTDSPARFTIEIPLTFVVR